MIVYIWKLNTEQFENFVKSINKKLEENTVKEIWTQKNTKFCINTVQKTYIPEMGLFWTFKNQTFSWQAWQGSLAKNICLRYAARHSYNQSCKTMML